MKQIINNLLYSSRIFYILLGISAFLIILNQFLIFDINVALGGGRKSNKLALSGNLSQDAAKIIMISGVPDIYGAELGVEYTSPANQQLMDQMIAKMNQYDPSYGKNKITLSGDKLKRYINIGSKIACEYCCGAKTLVFKDGKAACGCAHSQAMRGLAAYLIDKHGSEYTDDQILRELARWKGLYFPKQMISKLISQVQSGNYTPDIAAILLEVDKSKLSKNAANVPAPSSIENLPNMAGGC